jgi:hypothetical protein
VHCSGSAGHIRRSFFWEAGFALENAAHGRGIEDSTYAAGCAFRCVACLCQTLFAHNRVYLLNEKAAVAGVERLARRPADFAARVASAFADIAGDQVRRGLQILRSLADETKFLLDA